MAGYRQALTKQTALELYRITNNKRYLYAFWFSILSLAAVLVAIAFVLINFDIGNGEFRENALFLLLIAGILRSLSLFLRYSYGIAFYSIVVLIPICILLYISQ